MKTPGKSSLWSLAAASTCYLSLPERATAWSSSTNAAAFHSMATTAQHWTSPTATSSVPTRRGRSANLVVRHATIPKEEEALAAPASGDDDVVVAQGTVVSHFQGGLTAVRVSEDMVISMAVAPEAAIPEGIAAPGTRKNKGDQSASAAGDDLQGRNVVFADQSRGVVVAHRPPVIFVYRTRDEMNEDEPLALEGTVQILASRMTVGVPSKTGEDPASLNDLLGGTVEQESYTRAVFSPIPQVKDIALINNPMLTGVTMFDALAPIGRGQNMLFVGHDLDDMRKYTVDFLSNQIKSKPDIKCVYAAIDDVEKVTNLLQGQGIADSVQVVAPNQEDVDDMTLAAEAVATASTACAVAESYALRDGAHTIVVVDTLDWHKKLWDGTTRVLVDVFGIDAVVQGDRDGGASSEMRAFFSTLIQRAAQYKLRKGGGSVTLLLLCEIPPMQEAGEAVFEESDFEGVNDKVKARIQLLSQKKIPLTAANLRKIDIPIPSASEGKRRLVLQHVDDLISMSDGQIWFDEKLENNGQRPPLNPQSSVTRVGIGADTKSRADAPALRRIVEGMRLILSQAADMDGAEASAASSKELKRQKAFLLAMHQVSGTGGRTLSQSCAALLAASGGFLDEAVDEGALAGTEKGESTIEGLLQHLQSSIPDQMREIDESLDMSEETKQVLSEAIESYMSI